MPIRTPLLIGVSLVAIATTATLFPPAEKSSGSAAVAASPSPSAETAPRSAPDERMALFGDLHLHTGYSFDAWVLQGSTTTPDEAYRFGSGLPVKYMGQTYQREEPLDFMAVTDHAEFLGILQELQDPASSFARSPLGQRLLKAPREGLALYRQAFVTRKFGDLDTKRVTASGWARTIADANRYYRPGVYTTLIGYEWTAMADQLYNLHRNVIFKGDTAPLPFSAVDSKRPEDLWTYMEANRAKGIESLAIPHNANVSGGLMFSWNDSDGRPIGADYARRRAINEPLNEIVQGKGQSETSPMLSPNDEMANFEIFDQLLVPGYHKSKHDGSYTRQAYGRGLVIASRTGVNPFKMGMAGGSDFHNGFSTSSERAYGGNNDGLDHRRGVSDRERAKLLLQPHSPLNIIDLIKTSSSGLTGVWAEQNNRASIFAALQRKETFATSGTRIKVRFFGGWDLPASLLSSRDWVAKAYAGGVPMGGDLVGSNKSRVPTFILWSAKDPHGAGLQRLQIVKVALKGGDYIEKVFDVQRVRGAQGAATLAAVWRDPEFDAAQPSLYYVRAIEAPTPRWTTLVARQNRLPLPKEVPATHQERAWSSPIWYSPARTGEISLLEDKSR